MDEKPARTPLVRLESPEAYLNRELSWLSFARRVLALAEDNDLPILERVKFVGIMGMLHDEFFMKRMSGLKAQLQKDDKKKSLDGRTPLEEFKECRRELITQSEILSRVMEEEILPELANQGIPILSYNDLTQDEKKYFREYFEASVHPILTPLAVNKEHPFPFISNHGLNLAVLIGGENGGGA
jgi:polyphosphate kinase